MSIQIYIGHTGQRLTLDLNSASTVEALRSWITQQASIQPRNQILLTGQGKQVRTQTLLNETELFVFDSSQLSSKATASPSSSAASTHNDFNPGTPPDTISNQNDLTAWQNLFRLRKSWASGLLNGCDTRAKQAERYQDEQSIIERSLGVAVASLQQHVKSAEQKYLTAETWAEELLQDQDVHVNSWEQHLGSLRSVPARAEFARFIVPANQSNRRTSQSGGVTSLQGFVDVVGTRKAADTAIAMMDGLTDKVGKLRNELDAIGKQSEELLQAVEQASTQSSAQSTSEPAQLVEEITLVVKKMASDFEHVQSLPRSAQSAPQASKLAQLHTRNFLPALVEHCTEMNELVQRVRQQRDAAADTAQEHMRTLSGVESGLAELYANVKSLEVPEDDQQVFTTLTTISRLPSVYGQLLVESVRRREWVAKMKRDSATLQEEVATYQEEEDKRRKKWIRSVDDVVNANALQSNVLGIEISLQNEGGSWPMVTRDELQEYLNTLSAVYGQGPVTEEIEQAIKDLDKPTRKQIKHARAFKNGSMHEAAFGDTSLLLRGDEQYKSLRESNVRLEEDLRAQKSRVRKLEDVLHRQSQVSRTGTGDMFSPQSASFDRTASPTMPTPQPSGELSRDNSVRHRRPSSAQAIEEKRLARRVVDLEAELQTHTEEAASRKNSDAEALKQVKEAVSTKKDLMENMDAQQREFASERRTLERELAEVKERVEELENELDRLMGSRDDERNGIDSRVAAFEEEIARLKEDSMGHAARAANAQDAQISLERKLKLAESARAQAEAELRQIQMEQEARQEAEAEQLHLLAAAHNQLSPDVEMPSGLASLSAALEDLARRSAAHNKDLADAVAFAKSENESLWSSNERQKFELSKAADKQNDAEEQLRQAQETLDAEKAKAQSLGEQLSDEQEQLRTLREKFAEGETGSEVLRQRISEEENKAGKLTSELAAANSHINSMDVELMRLQKKHKAYHASAEASSERLAKRAERAKEVSQRLYSQNTRLGRLLEQMGLVLSYRDDGSMFIERASKMNASTMNASTTISELPGDSFRPGDFSRTVSMTSPPPTRKSSSSEETADPSLVHWVDAQTPEDEASRFDAFIQHISRFNIDYVSEQVHKRLRDYEYTAKKFNKEWRESSKRAEAYKERSIKLKSDSHAKISVNGFKEGDLALFLPTRGQAKGAWAAFNINCPHYFLAERDGMRLGTREFIVARISKVEQKTVDLSRSITSQNTNIHSVDDASDAASLNDDNPFELSDGLTWWMVHATEERGAGGGAPTTPGLGKSTVAAANVDAKGSIRTKRSSKGEDASKVLNKSLDSRRSSSASKKGVSGALVPTLANSGGSPMVSDAVAVRSRSESQASLRPPPAPAAGGGGNSGLGIISDSDTQPGFSEQVRQLRSTTPSQSRSESPAKPLPRQRSMSPSKSVRSLQRLIEPRPQSPAKSPAKTPVKVKQPGWESLWQAEYTLESPGKNMNPDV
ncbi:oligomeric, coiled-coil, peripheral membrane protein [Elasticomyces elasticus]|uniref:Autophagy-related protein 11 n=1 Tax=Elasticomyces elasticus TaxID=574655 RepID=A0AAN7W292_9PEZI|nr:oligomeric, coiled-coil, peripheral membrane protein [Elasticomyces elasticus]